MHECPYCLSQSPSVSAMFACELECSESDANTREYFGKYDPHRKD